MDRAYTIISALLEPLMPVLLYVRMLRGKEDGKRLSERLGKPSLPRPKQPLIWIHAASVGEAVSVLPLIQKLRSQYPDIAILMTTGTRTSAALMKARLPKEVMHQYAPIDTSGASWRFMRHWRPEVVLFVESEYWPNLIRAANSWQCFMVVINGRMSERSYMFWRKYPKFIGRMLQSFNLFFTQSPDDQARLLALGAKEVHITGNLKYDAPPLPCDEAALLAFSNAVGERPVWVAASTHPGEEEIVAQAHAALLKAHPNALLILVPRHPGRGGELAAELQKTFRIGIRSRGDMIGHDMQIFIVDTLGELGLFYRLSPIVFMGGSLVPHGGQNPLEPARLSCAILTGPHTHNFADIYRDLERAGGCMRVSGANALAAQIGIFLTESQSARALQAAAKGMVDSQVGATDRLLEWLQPVLHMTQQQTT